MGTERRLNGTRRGLFGGKGDKDNIVGWGEMGVERG